MSSTSSLVSVLTGSTGSIGESIARGLAKLGHTVILPVRDVKKGQILANSISKATGNQNILVEQVELGKRASMSDFVHRVEEKYPHIDILINNAAVSPAKKEFTADGLEAQFGINIYSYFYLMNAFRPLLKKAGNARVVLVASNYAGGLNEKDLEFQSTPYDTTVAYKQSKQANRQLAKVAADKFAADGISVFACHPGVVTSNLLGGLGMATGPDSPDKGAETPLFLATDSSITAKHSGTYWHTKKQVDCPFQKNTEQSNALWKYLEQTDERLAKEKATK